MVRAILDGRKTQTRRVIKPQADSYTGDALGQPVIYPVSENPEIIHGDQPIKCPYGQPGDLLYVRETFAKLCKEGDPYCWCETEDEKEENHIIQFKADTYHEFRGEGKYDQYPGNWDDAPFPPGKNNHPEDADYIPRWKPSIHMPKDIARIWLEVKSVHVEQVQQISVDDVWAEGVQIPTINGNPVISLTDKYTIATYLEGTVSEWEKDDFIVAHFAKLWDEINADRGYSWKSNPWVWVVEFTVKEVTS